MAGDVCVYSGAANIPPVLGIRPARLLPRYSGYYADNIEASLSCVNTIA